jgi:hypothetical protein
MLERLPLTDLEMVNISLMRHRAKEWRLCSSLGARIATVAVWGCCCRCVALRCCRKENDAEKESFGGDESRPPLWLPPPLFTSVLPGVFMFVAPGATDGGCNDAFMIAERRSSPLMPLPFGIFPGKFVVIAADGAAAGTPD